MHACTHAQPPTRPARPPAKPGLSMCGHMHTLSHVQRLCGLQARELRYAYGTMKDFAKARRTVAQRGTAWQRHGIALQARMQTK